MVTGRAETYVVTMVKRPESAGEVLAATLDDGAVEVKGGAARVPTVGDGGRHRVRIEVG